ncbi:MAG: arylamine N-acetyltransferase [Ilumatobacteraceae bacterium]
MASPMMFSAERYLQRIGMSAQTGAPTVDLLAGMQVAHLTRVPFENLSVYHHRCVRTDVQWSYPKIVERRRGGWCFELNGCFGALLREVGFHVDYVSCQVWNDPGQWGPPFDHLGLIVHLDGERWFVDVGFGDNCLVPVAVRDGEHTATPRRARIEVSGDGGSFVMAELMSDGSWLNQLRVTLRSAALTEFGARSDYLRTNPDLSWSTKPFATRALGADGSRITLRRDVLRIRSATQQPVDTPVQPQQWSGLLAEHFGLVDTL